MKITTLNDYTAAKDDLRLLEAALGLVRQASATMLDVRGFDATSLQVLMQTPISYLQVRVATTKDAMHEYEQGQSDLTA